MIGVGIDAVDVDRFRSVLQRRGRIDERLFTDGERAYAGRSVDPTERLAARFAAKEAVMKVLGVGVGAVRFREIEVVKLPSGRPELRLHGRAAELADAAGATSWHLSLTHTHSVAEAVVIAE
ncbi:MAG: holo-ACP synthase [Actinomycetota bacterium]|jgi:holo-[acyl-carrier protein] synthase|nr:holo-ACP synthase [Actinomycetota bacterium]